MLYKIENRKKKKKSPKLSYYDNFLTKCLHPEFDFNAEIQKFTLSSNLRLIKPDLKKKKKKLMLKYPLLPYLEL